MGNPNKVKVGPGLLYANAVGAPEPVDLTTPWATISALWVAIGYTDDGHEFNFEPSFDGIEVAEELTPIRYEENKREISVNFACAEMTKSNLQAAFNGGTIVTGTGIVTITPPTIGASTRIAIGWESDDHQERWVFRKCVQVGQVTVARKKSPNKSTIPMQMRCEKPSGLDPFKIILVDP